MSEFKGQTGRIITEAETAEEFEAKKSEMLNGCSRDPQNPAQRRRRPHKRGQRDEQ